MIAKFIDNKKKFVFIMIIVWFSFVNVSIRVCIYVRVDLEIYSIRNYIDIAYRSKILRKKKQEI